MASLKLSQDLRRKRRDGTYPVIVRLTSNQKSTSIDTGIKLLSEEWDSSKARVTKLSPNHKELNYHLKKQLLDLETELLKIGMLAQEMNISALRDVLINKNKKKHHHLL